MSSTSADDADHEDGREREVAGLSDLTHRVVTSAGERVPQLHRWLVIALRVLLGVCLLATLTRLSPLPLLPIPALLVAYYAERRLQGARTRRQLVGFTSLLACGFAVGFWAMGFVPDLLD